MKKLQFANGDTLNITDAGKVNARYNGERRDALVVELPYVEVGIDGVYALLTEENCAVIRLYEGDTVQAIFDDYCIRGEFRVEEDTDMYTGESVKRIVFQLFRMTYAEKKLRG